ncbi:MAG: hypothetical protein HQ495_14150 [Alphaproteobacteria bacterium]|nr:hypothetical protein [Alphaproteobacteria bacterium]
MTLLLAASAIPTALAMQEETASISLSGTVEPMVQVGLVTTRVGSAQALNAETAAPAIPTTDPTTFFLGTTVVLISEASNVEGGYTMVFESIPSRLGGLDSSVLLGGTRTPDAENVASYEFSFGGVALPLDQRRMVLTRPADQAGEDVRTRNAALRIKRLGKPNDTVAANSFRLVITGP